MIRRLIISLCLLVLVDNTYSEILLLTKDTLKSNNFFQQKKYGFAYDFALNSENILYEYETYKPQVFQIVYLVPLSKKSKIIHYSICLLPQINSVRIIDKFKEMRDYEFGINIEFVCNHIINNNLAIYTSVGTGPHYISHDRGKQAGGFIFNDNFVAGFRYKLDDEYEFKLHFKFRHLSNANIKLPNWGINNYMIGMSLMKNFCN